MSATKISSSSSETNLKSSELFDSHRIDILSRSMKPNLLSEILSATKTAEGGDEDVINVEVTVQTRLGFHTEHIQRRRPKGFVKAPISISGGSASSATIFSKVDDHSNMSLSVDGKILLCFDFDQTIVNGHFHSILSTEKSKFIPSDGKSSYDIISRTKSLLEEPSTGLKNPELLLEVIQLALRNGHFVAITSFNKYPECFVPALEKLGLSPGEIDSIPRFGGFPMIFEARKNDHIRRAMARFRMTNNNMVWLIDDDFGNCRHAIAEGFNAVEVPVEEDAPADYLKELLNILRN
eukprot:gene33105-42822_t